MNLITSSLLLLGSAVALTLATASHSLDAAYPLSPSPFFVELTDKIKQSSRTAHSKTQLLCHLSGQDFVGKLVGVDSDNVYATSVIIGGQAFKVIFDTGSTDLWVGSQGFRCENATNYPEPQSACGLAASLYDTRKSKTFKAQPGLKTYIQYGDGEVVNGTVGLDTISIAGLTVINQEFGVVNSAYFVGDGVTSGVFGLAHPDLTQLYNISTGKDAYYSPFFYTAVQQTSVEPHFSIALNRASSSAKGYNSTYDPSLGYVAFGGLPPVSVTTKRAVVQAQTFKIPNTLNTSEYLWWTVPVDRYVFPGSTALPTNGTAIIDSGNSLIDLPPDIAAAYNKQFNPPAHYDEDSGSYFVSCHAKPPPFSVVLGGVTFTLSSKDLILPVGNGSQFCTSAIQDGGPASPTNVYVLGDPFLRNVVATFHTDSEMVSFIERAPY